MSWDTVKVHLHSIGAWVQKHWKALVYGILGALGLITGVSVWRKIRVLFDSVPVGSSTVQWIKSKEDPTSISVVVPESGEIRKVTLPTGQVSDSITCVGYDSDKHILIVEVAHEKTDRRNTTPIANSAFDTLTKRNPD
jgi:tricorn protease-like protein